MIKPGFVLGFFYGFFMKTFGFFLGAVFLLGGCVPTMASIESRPSVSAAGAFDFNWQLSGDPSVAPVQVFSHSQQVWLQFDQRQYLPAIFGVKEGQSHALTYQRYDPYVVIEGQWQELLFQGGHLQARARHASVMPLAHAAPASDKAPQPASANPAPNPEPKSATERPAAEPAPTQTATALSLGPLERTSVTPIAPEAEQKAPAPALSKRPALASLRSTPPRPSFQISPSDDTLRQAIQRWAQEAGWNFSDQHWGLEVDYPIINTADFSGEFPEAVSQLLDSVRMGAKPMRACFYSNQVLRIIPATQSCHPTGQRARQHSGGRKS